jgi:hypothetical protein
MLTKRPINFFPAGQLLKDADMKKIYQMSLDTIACGALGFRSIEIMK